MMRLSNPPLAMGLMMGLMIPFLLHAETPAGLGFVLAHVAVLGGGAVLFLLVPGLRSYLRPLLSHRPSFRHLPRMALGLAAGWSIICLFCIALDGSHF
ncbi:hypothetical protein [Dinoroseobacter sp. S76]|uniref:hypothetical protein n=1 Tax=Dinoroseobacter sp. S76 TaxID=3415124 RepID=UPI003C7BA068